MILLNLIHFHSNLKWADLVKLNLIAYFLQRTRQICAILIYCELTAPGPGVATIVVFLHFIFEQPPNGQVARQPAWELHDVLHGVAEQICIHSVVTFEQVLISHGADVQFESTAWEIWNDDDASKIDTAKSIDFMLNPRRQDTWRENLGRMTECFPWTFNITFNLTILIVTSNLAKFSILRQLHSGADPGGAMGARTPLKIQIYDFSP